MGKITSREALIHEVADAMQMRFNDCRPLLDLTTQEVGEWTDPVIFGNDCKWPNEGDEVIEIEVPSSHESFHAMEEFAGSQSDTIARRLWHVLDGKRPFARFKDTVHSLGIQNKWYDFQNEWYEEKAEEWLCTSEVDVKDGRIVTTGDDSFIWEEKEEE